MSASSIKEGLSYLKGQPLLQSGFLIDLNAMIFGMPHALFPALGTEIFGGDASTVGLLYAAPGMGALIAALTSGWVGSVSRWGPRAPSGATRLTTVSMALGTATPGRAASSTLV